MRGRTALLIVGLVLLAVFVIIPILSAIAAVIRTAATIAILVGICVVVWLILKRREPA